MLDVGDLLLPYCIFDSSPFASGDVGVLLLPIVFCKLRPLFVSGDVVILLLMNDWTILLQKN